MTTAPAIRVIGLLQGVDLVVRHQSENLVLVAQLRHLKEAGRVADDLLARFDLVEAGARRVATYSGGCAGAWTSR